jgi:hypothetical protein
LSETIVVKLAAVREDAQKKNSWRLSEVDGDPDDPKLGDVYVPKATLVALGWTKDDRLTVELSV